MYFLYLHVIKTPCELCDVHYLEATAHHLSAFRPTQFCTDFGILYICTPSTLEDFKVNSDR